MIDLNQVSLALRNATSRSLILLDEFGKGTVSADGAGLFFGILRHLIERKSGCPKVLAATHFHELFRDDIIIAKELPVTFVHMRVVLTSSKGEIFNPDSVDGDNDLADDAQGEVKIMPGEQITYLYKIGRGLSLNSFAAMCAELFGVPRQIVQRAQYVSHLLSIHELGQLLDEEMTEDERVELEEAEEVCRKFLAWDLEAGNEDTREEVRETLTKVVGRVMED